MSAHIFRKKQWSHVQPSASCVRLKLACDLCLTLRWEIKCTACSQTLSGSHLEWECSCCCLWAGGRARCFLTFPSQGVLKHWAPLNMCLHLTHAHWNHASFWTTEALLKKAQFPDLASEHCFCSAMRVSCAGRTLHYLVYLWSIIACVSVRGSLRLAGAIKAFQHPIPVYLLFLLKSSALEPDEDYKYHCWNE